jgi:branched-chain amino acid transport system substrate-binding protein
MKHSMKNVKRKMFRTAFLLAACISLLSGLSGCDRKSQPVKIGFAGSLTGQFSDLGLAGRNGAILAVEQINNAGGIQGRPVELIVKNDQNDPDVAVQVDTDLINEGVAALIGHMTSTMSKAVVHLFNDAKIVMVSPTTTTNDLTGLDDYFFRTCTPDLDQTQQLIRYAFHERGLKKLAVVYDLANRGYSEGWVQNARSEFERLGGNFSRVVPFTSGKDTTHSDIVKELLSSHPEGILIIAAAIDTATICQELRKAGSHLPVFNSGWAAIPKLIQHGGSAVEGIALIRTFDEQSTREHYLEFKKHYYERFKIEPNFAAAGAYDAAQQLLNALAHAETPEHVKKAIAAQPLFHGLQGDISMDQYGDPRRDVFIFTVKNGEFTHLKTLE